jgi:hypothetical protein
VSLSHSCPKNGVVGVIEKVSKSNRISRMIMAGYIVRNDEVVGSSPTSSTKFCFLISQPFLPTSVD